MAEIKEIKISIAKSLFDAKELIEEYYQQQLNQSSNTAIILKNRLDLKDQLTELNEYIRVLVQNFYYGSLLLPELLEDKYNQELFNVNRINFQVNLLNAIELIHQFREELNNVLPDNPINYKLESLVNKSLEENSKLLIIEQQFTSKLRIPNIICLYYSKSLPSLYNFVRIKEHGGGYIPPEYLNQFIVIFNQDYRDSGKLELDTKEMSEHLDNINKVKKKYDKKGYSGDIFKYFFNRFLNRNSTEEPIGVPGSIWQYLIPAGLVPCKVIPNISNECNYLIIDLYPTNFKGEYTLYHNITDNVLRELSVSSSTIKNALKKSINDPFSLTINDSLRNTKALYKFEEMIKDYRKYLTKKLDEGVNKTNNDLNIITERVCVEYNIKTNGINIHENSPDLPFVVISKLCKDKFIVYSSPDGQMIFDTLSDIPLINKIMKLATLVRSKDWVNMVLSKYDLDNKIKVRNNTLEWDLKQKNDSINKFHMISENNYGKLHANYYENRENPEITIPLNSKEFLDRINIQLNMYQRCVTNILTNNPNISIIENIPKTIRSPALDNILFMDNLEWYKQAILDTLISHKIQLMILKRTYLTNINPTSRGSLESVLNALHKCINNCMKNIYILKLKDDELET